MIILSLAKLSCLLSTVALTSASGPDAWVGPEQVNAVGIRYTVEEVSHPWPQHMIQRHIDLLGIDEEQAALRAQRWEHSATYNMLLAPQGVRYHRESHDWKPGEVGSSVPFYERVFVNLARGYRESIGWSSAEDTRPRGDVSLDGSSGGGSFLYTPLDSVLDVLAGARAFGSGEILHPEDFVLVHEDLEEGLRVFEFEDRWGRIEMWTFLIRDEGMSPHSFERWSGRDAAAKGELPLTSIVVTERDEEASPFDMRRVEYEIRLQPIADTMRRTGVIEIEEIVNLGVIEEDALRIRWPIDSFVWVEATKRFYRVEENRADQIINFDEIIPMPD